MATFIRRIVAWTATIATLAAPLAASGAEVRLAGGGAVAGEAIATLPVARYLGIPFAAPPTGEDRWRPPAAARPWTGVRQAVQFAPACMQPRSALGAFYADDPPLMSEDCLYLNVWAPKHATHAPVMVWIHGGSLLTGTASSERYDGAKLAAKGVVVVTINYRLGVFGYLALPALSAESPHGVSGNYGLLDQIRALHWVHDNVAAFGGDPGRVTVFGESAGALSVTHLLVSPLAQGLFQRAIAESPYSPSAPELKRARFGQPSAEKIGASFSEGAKAPNLGALRAMDAQVLIDAARTLGFAPQATIDGHVLPQQIFEAFEAGSEAQVPILMGFNSGEFRAFEGVLPPPPATPRAYVAAVQERYGALSDAYLRLYPAAAPAESMLSAARDGLFGWATQKLIRLHSKRAASYLYYFDQSYPAAEARGVRAFHSSEISYVLGEVGRGARKPPNWPAAPDRPQDVSLSETMMAQWTAFARDGRPTAAKADAWPAFGPHAEYMRFGDGRASKDQNLLPGAFAFQERIVGQRRAKDQHWFLDVGLAAPQGGP